MADPMKVDPNSGVEHAAVLSLKEARAIFNRAWEPMIEHGVHLANRPFETDGVTEGIVIVARGEAARMLQRFCRTEIPGADGSPPPGREADRVPSAPPSTAGLGRPEISGR